MNRSIAVAVAAAVAFTSIATPTLAKRRPVVVAAARIVQNVDTDNSHTISLAEFTTAGRPEANFAVIDKNANGQLGIFEIVRVLIARARAGREG
jgi:hypothetical protein